LAAQPAGADLLAAELLPEFALGVGLVLAEKFDLGVHAARLYNEWLRESDTLPLPFPETLPTIEYGPGDSVRKVAETGFISFKHRPWRIGKAFRGQPVAVRPTVEDGVFHVHYCTHRIAVIDLRGPPTAACGVVDNARALPTTPQAPLQQ